MCRVLFAAWALVLPASLLPAAEKRNVLFLAVDDLRPALGCAGDSHAKSPNLDALAKRGTVFTRAYCQQAVCSPSRSSLMTGRRPDTTKVYDLVTHFRTHIPDVVTIPQHFKAHGYTARGVGKIYHGGYDDTPSWSAPWEGTKGKNFGPGGQAVMAKARAEAEKEKREVSRVRGLPYEAPEVDDEYLNDGWTANRGIELLNELKDKPFFLAVGFAKPHLPFVAPKKYWDLYDPAMLPKAPHPAPPQGAPKFALTNSGELRAYVGIPKDPDPVTAEQERKLVHGYYAAVSYMDAQVGRVLAELDRLKLRDNTVVVLWGDHGWHLNDHGQWCKHTNYEVATRAALILSAPGQKVTDAKCDKLVEFVDIYPTLAQAAGLPAPAGVEGTSFAPLLDDPKREWKKAAFSQYPRGQVMGYAMRTDRYRLVEWREKKTGEAKEYELYDHKTDPGENVNVAGRAENKALVATLAKELKAGWVAAGPPGK